MTDYGNSWKLALDSDFAGRVTMCCVEQARAKIDAATGANIDAHDLMLALDISRNSQAATSRLVSLMCSDPAFAAAFVSGYQGVPNREEGVTDGQIQAAVDAYWHQIATG